MSKKKKKHRPLPMPPPEVETLGLDDFTSGEVENLQRKNVPVHVRDLRPDKKF